MRWNDIGSLSDELTAGGEKPRNRTIHILRAGGVAFAAGACHRLLVCDVGTAFRYHWAAGTHRHSAAAASVTAAPAHFDRATGFQSRSRPAFGRDRVCAGAALRKLATLYRR